MYKKPKNNVKGITLVALVITIIVLLILAGITIQVVLGENGLLKRANNTKQQYTKEEIKEKLMMEIADIQIKNGREVTLEDIGKISIEDLEINVGSIGRVITVTKDDITYSYWVDENMNIIENTGQVVIEKGDEKYNKFKEEVALALTQEGIETSKTDSDAQIIENVHAMSTKRFEDGRKTRLILIQENVSSRYVQTISIADREDFGNFTVDDFVIVNKQMTYCEGSDDETVYAIQKKYNAETGILTLGRQKSYAHAGNYVWTFWNIYDVYLKVIDN